MEHENEHLAPALENRVGSEDPLLEPTAAPTRSSNRFAVKVAAITTLVCLLVSAQAFTAYMVFDQRDQIQDLQRNHQRLQEEMSRSPRAPPQKLVFPSSPLMAMFDDVLETSTPEPKARPSVEEELQEFMKDVELPHFNKSFLDQLQIVREKMDENSWKGFESWLRYWLLFQTAQKTPTPRFAHLAQRTKCQVEASGSAGNGQLGSFRPQCDEYGNYKSRQCWASTGHCWCVDEHGVRITRTNNRGHQNCDKVRSSRKPSHSAMKPLFTAFQEIPE